MKNPLSGIYHAILDRVRSPRSNCDEARKPTDWNEDVQETPQEKYRALLRALQRRKGFGVLFVECSPARGERLIADVKQDLPRKKIEILPLREPIAKLFPLVEALPNREAIDVLFVTGLEYSLLDYEEIKRQQGWEDLKVRSYSWEGVPPILNHLNQHRERFRDSFNCCFVFLLPKFAVNYLIHRAPDFFDWRSGVFELPMNAFSLWWESSVVSLASSDYLKLTPQERRKKLVRIQAILDEPQQTAAQKANLLFERGLLHSTVGEYVEAIDSYDRAVTIKPDDDAAWYNRGIALFNLGRYEEAIKSYDRALKIKPDKDAAWYNRGIALFNLGRYEEAIKSYDRALTIKPDKDEAWYNRGIALFNLGRYEEALESYDRALTIKPDKDEAWNNRGIALGKLGRYAEAIKSYDRALTIKLDLEQAWYNKACCYALQGDAERAIVNLQKAIDLNPEKYWEMPKTDSDFDSIRADPDFQALISPPLTDSDRA